MHIQYHAVARFPFMQMLHRVIDFTQREVLNLRGNAMTGAERQHVRKTGRGTGR